jgi:hypothetical protein
MFSSQTKENHVTKLAKSVCELSEEIIKKIEKLGITANVIEIAKAKENKSLSKTDGSKKIRLSGIPKLDDANYAGTSQGTSVNSFLQKVIVRKHQLLLVYRLLVVITMVCFLCVVSYSMFVMQRQLNFSRTKKSIHSNKSWDYIRTRNTLI